jgi:hypothetical protein
MMRRLWIGGLILSALGWATDVAAQQGIWHRVEPRRGQPGRVVRMSSASLHPTPQVSLGQPVSLGKPTPLSIPDPSPPRTLEMPPTGIVPAGYPIPPGPLASTKALEARIIAASSELAWDDARTDQLGQGKGSSPDLFTKEAGQLEAKPGLDYLPDPGPTPDEKTPVPPDSYLGPTGYQDWSEGPTSPQDPPAWVVAASEAALPAIESYPHPVEAYPQPEYYPPRLYFRGEYLLWWVKQDDVPVLLTTSDPVDFGFLGRPTTEVLFGGSSLDRDPRSGARFLVGYELSGLDHKAVEIAGFFLGRRSRDFVANSAFTPLIARPFFADNLGEEFSEVLAFPGLLTGNGTVEAPSELWGLEANLRTKLFCAENYGVSFLAGIRYLNLDESITITENVLGLPTNPNPDFQNQRITVIDRFAAENEFLGGQVGVESRHVWGRWSVDLMGKIALGGTRQVVQIAGSQEFIDPGGQISNFQGGLLALPSNIGRRTGNEFTVVPEFAVRLGYQITPRVRATVGYNFLYWSNVVRPGDQIDRVLDITQIPNFRDTTLSGVPSTGGTRPDGSLRTSDLWLQGFTVGLEVVW